MKILDMTCQQCGAKLQVDMEKNQAVCPHCGNQVFVDDEVKHIQYDNAEEAGYMFEKGRQRAQAEAANAQMRSQVTSSDNANQAQSAVYYQRNGQRAKSDKQPEKNYTWLWVLGWICFFPAPVMVLIWREKNTWDIKAKIAVTVAFWVVIFAIGSSGDSSNSSSTDASKTDSKAVIQEEENDKEKTAGTNNSLYANAEIVDMMSGSGKNVIGTITVAHAKQAECTDEALSDWYMNYVKKNTDSKYHVIIYDDKSNLGVYANGTGFIQKDIELKKETDGTYACGDDAGSTYYTVGEDGSLSILSSMADASIIYGVEDKVDAIIPEEYKLGELYEVDVAGPEGALDCNLVLINPDFADTDCQAIALELAKKVQGLDLGIGYFSISFQSDDYTLNALSSVDLSEQDATEITTMNL